MIEMVTGKPGSGKSYFALDEGVDELRFGGMTLVTNLAIHIDILNEYFQRKGRKFVDVFSRVRLITRDEAREFWRFRSTYSVLPNKENPVEIVSEIENGKADIPPCFYIIDEAHILFDARSWKKSAAELTIYNSQHRKLQDRVFFVTQYLKLVETRVKGFAEKFHVCRNFAGVKSLFFIQMPGRMRQQTFYSEPSPQNNMPDEERWVALNKELASCYDTMAGVGVSGWRKPEERKAKGFRVPWWSVFIALVLGGVALAVLPTRCALFLVRKEHKLETALSGKASALVPHSNAGAGGRAAGVGAALLDNGIASGASKLVLKVSPVKIIGRLSRDSHLVILLDDGRTLRDGAIRTWSKDFIVDSAGNIYYFKRPSFSAGPVYELPQSTSSKYEVTIAPKPVLPVDSVTIKAAGERSEIGFKPRAHPGSVGAMLGTHGAKKEFP